MRHFVKMHWLVLVISLACIACGQSGTSTPSTSSTSTTPGASSTTGGQSAASTAAPSASASAPVAAPAPIEIPAGTSVVVTADEAVSSKTANPGDHFAASLAAPVMVHGVEVIPVGARASGRVTESKSAGKLKGAAELSVTLSSITVNGQPYEVMTSSVVEAGKARGKRTAVGAGGGAAVGAIIGALAGHGKGAAIGAAAGAGAGTAGAAFTGDTEVTIAPETQLRFKLTSALEVPGK